VTREGHLCASERLSVITEGVDRGAPIVRIYGSDDSFVLLDEDCPADADDYDGQLVVVCMGCLLEEHPEAARGLDLAKNYGAAHLADGEWIGGEAACS
jgi:hypothetical protein